MVNCEVIKANTVFADEIFHFQDMRSVKPGIGDLTGATISDTKAKICVLECNVSCSSDDNKLHGDITFGICEDFKINGKPVEYFFRSKKTFIFQKTDCRDFDLSDCIVSPLKCQIVRVSATNSITIEPPETPSAISDTFKQTLDIEVKIIVEAEKMLCVEVCKDTGTVSISKGSTMA